MTDYSTISLETSCMAAAISIASWITFYLILCQLNNKTPEWNCRILTALHGIVVVCMSAWCGFVQGPWPFTHPGGVSTPLQHLTIIISLGYFVFDTSWCFHYQAEGLLILLHHVCCVTFLAMTVMTSISGTDVIAVLFGSEITNPFLQLRWFLKQAGSSFTRLRISLYRSVYVVYCCLALVLMAVGYSPTHGFPAGYKNTWFTYINDLIFMALFGCVRMGVGSCLFYSTMLHPAPRWYIKLGGVFMYAISWVFWLQIVRSFFRKLRKVKLRVDSRRSSVSNGFAKSKEKLQKTEILLNGEVRPGAANGTDMAKRTEEVSTNSLSGPSICLRSRECTSVQDRSR